MMRISFFGSSLVSAYWNGAATYYRGIIRALHRRGHRITFFEPDAYSRQQHRDIENPAWANVVVYPANEAGVARALAEGRQADLIVKASGVGVFDAFLEKAVLELKNTTNLVAFWDVDAPATLDRIRKPEADPFSELIPKYDLVFTYGGGDPVVSAYKALGARTCIPIYNALDPDTHFPVPKEDRFAADLSFLGNRLPDREQRVQEFFFKAAARLHGKQFLLGGAGWNDKRNLPNVRYIDHVYTRDHNAFNSAALAVLNVARDSMARYGFSPATRIFEAAGAGACIISDAWAGLDHFLEPGKEILVAENGEEVMDHLLRLTPKTAKFIGESAHRRIAAAHTYAHRAAEVDAALAGGSRISMGGSGQMFAGYSVISNSGNR